METINKTRGIYKITCKVNGKNYIGSSDNIQRRWRSHISRSARLGSPLYDDIQKFGLESFTFTVITECEKNEKATLEREYIKKYDSTNPEKGYNIYKMESINPGGQKSDNIQLNVDVPADLLKELKLYCLKNNLNVKDVVSQILRDFLKSQEEK